MKNKKISYLGFVVGFISLLAMFIFKDNETLNRVLPFIFTISVTFSSVYLGHNKKMEEDTSYRININDERNEKIRDKVNATMTPILMLIMGLAAVICFSTNDYLPENFWQWEFYLFLLQLFLSADTMRKNIKLKL